MSIFVSIAAYRDSQLIPTVLDCLDKAAKPADLRFGICWQTDDDDDELPFARDPRFRIRRSHWRESRGVCWARAEITRLWAGEDLFLQIDAHTRFVPGWDEILAAALARAGPKAVLSAYPFPFQPDSFDRAGRTEPFRSQFHCFTDGIPSFRARCIPGWATLEAPVPARYISAGFVFAPGSFVADVPYDPGLYFHGEEITLTVRAFTHGYDLFHPHRHVLWHHYGRAGEPRHWDDHTSGSHGGGMPWFARDQASLARVRSFLAEPAAGAFGCGSVRTFEAYERYAALDLATAARLRLTTQPKADGTGRLRAGSEPTSHVVEIELDPWAISRGALDEIDLLYVAIHDGDGRVILRRDALPWEIEGLRTRSTARLTLERRFRSDRRPAGWAVRPYGVAQGWGEPLTGMFGDLDHGGSQPG